MRVSQPIYIGNFPLHIIEPYEGRKSSRVGYRPKKTDDPAVLLYREEKALRAVHVEKKAVERRVKQAANGRRDGQESPTIRKRGELPNYGSRKDREANGA